VPVIYLESIVNKKRVLVFGAAGFIGTYLIDELVAQGYEVTASDISAEGLDFYKRAGVEYVNVDITRKEDFTRLIGPSYDAVIHLAACQPANVAEKRYDPRDYINVNVVGTLNILDYCRANGAGKIIYASSHRNTQGLWAPNKAIKEEDGRAIKYSGEYAMFSISESAAQDCVLHYQEQYGLTGILFRLPPVYGYGPHTEIFKEGKPIKTGFQIFIDKARACEPLEVWGDCDVGRDIIYVKDAVSAFVNAIEKPGVCGLYNITSGVYLSLREQAEIIAKTFWGSEGEPVIVYRSDVANGMDAFLYDNSKAKRALDWSPQYSFQEMLIDFEKESASGKYRYLVDKRLKMLK
jgi:UDP-glucose 4-epimerase